MFNSIQRGLGFLGQTIDLARKYSDLFKPSLFSRLVSAVVAIIGARPMLAVAFLAGDSQAARSAGTYWVGCSSSSNTPLPTSSRA